MKTIDEVGNHYGRLTVVNREGSSDGARWLCLCDCGKETIVSGVKLRRGDTKSCGCLIRQTGRPPSHSLPKGVSTFNRLYGRYRRIAEQRGLSWGLTKEQFGSFIYQDCHYCGEVPSIILKPERSNGGITHNSIDRIDSSEGYIINNVIPCCDSCNRTKMASDLKKFKDRIRKIYHHWAREEQDD